MPAFTLSPAAARLVSVHTQGLAVPPARPARKEDVLQAVQTLSMLQIDTINIVARAPYLALFSRLGDYTPAWLDELLAEGKLFEYWAHAASFLPSEDYPLHRRLCIENTHTGWLHRWYLQNQAAYDGVLEIVRTKGAARSADFERGDGEKGTWWNWKVEKRALEYWFARGELMTLRRQNFQRVYAPRERVRPGWDDRDAPPLEFVDEQLALKSVRAIGIVKASWVSDYFRRPKAATIKLTQRLAAEGRLLEGSVEGWSEPAYAHPDRLALLAQAEAGSLSAAHTTLLTPFDSLICDRTRTRDLFGFDFAIECYLPAAKRKYGYFLLPILRRGELVGRLDAKAHRKDKLFEVKALYLEPEQAVDDALAADLARALHECAAWHGAAEVLVRRCEPASLLEPLLQALKAF